MKIAIDVSAAYTTKAGTSTYIRELTSSLANHIDVIELSYVPRFARSNKLMRKIDVIQRDIFWIQNKLPVLAQKEKAQLLHCPAMLGPIHSKIPTILTILDLYIIKNSKAFPFWQNNLINLYLPKLIKTVSGFIAISDFTKHEFLECFPHVPESKIKVTWLGVNDIFKPVKKEIVQEYNKKSPFNRPFFLSVSTIEPRKNLNRLIVAYANIKDNIDHDLVLTGSYGWKSKDLYDLINKLKIDNRVKFTGYIPLSELPIIYSMADAFLYPSLYEGFGLPPIEAMACGCPVLTSNVSSLPEVVGDAAITVNPLCIDEIAEGMLSLVYNGDKREALRQKGLARAKLFSWENCAQETIKAYTKAI
jgi:glycosyltransferase involved in cell wall biosynthesis